ncbi:MAG: CHAD domain-containing protein [Saprospiraceae bacterium]|nr:CHAD domain-containing protein [Saprospiraceae bacterium]
MSKHFSSWVNDVYTTLELELLELLDFYHHQPRKRIVHQMRLNLKKQLAFFQMIQLPPEILGEHINVIRRFQKLLGKTRAIQVQEQKAKIIEQALNTEDLISKQFKDLEKTHTHNWRRYLKEESIALAMKSIREGLALSYQHLPLEIFQQHLKEQMHHILFNIKALSNIVMFDAEKFHELRTNFKQLIYFSEWLQPIFHHLPFAPATIEEIRQIDRTIGEWHDYVALLKKVDKEEKEALAFAIKEQIEVHILEARAQLSKVESFLSPIEAYFSSS